MTARRQQREAWDATTPLWPSAEGAANAAASDWQIVLQLKELFRRDPRLIRNLLDGLPKRSRRCVAAVFAAAREAASDEPDRMELQRLAGEAALRAGEPLAAGLLLSRVIGENPAALADIAPLLTRWAAAARQPGAGPRPQPVCEERTSSATKPDAASAS